VWHLGNEILLLETFAFAIQILARSFAGAANDLSHRHLPPPTFEKKDEMWRKIITESQAFTATATAWTCCSFFFLRDLGAPTFHAEWVFFMMVAYYLIGFFFSWRRYK